MCSANKVMDFSYNTSIEDLAELLSTEISKITPEQAEAFMAYEALKGRKWSFGFDENKKCNKISCVKINKR